MTRCLEPAPHRKRSRFRDQLRSTALKSPRSGWVDHGRGATSASLGRLAIGGPGRFRDVPPTKIYRDRVRSSALLLGRGRSLMSGRQHARVQGIPRAGAGSAANGVPLPTQRGLPARRDGSRTTASEPGLPAALLAHAVVRLLSLAVLYVASYLTGHSAFHALTRWDAAWYRGIAENGYGHGHLAADGRQLTDYVFFPLYPGVERVVSEALGLTVVQAGLVVSAVASFVAAAGIYRVGEHLHDARVGLVLVCLWSSLPVSVVQSMAYTESLFTAFVAWSLYALLVHRYLAAGVLAALAGLTRPLGAALVIAVMVSVLTWLAEEQARGPVPDGSVRRRRAMAGAALAPLGLVAYLGYVGWAEHRPLGYLDAARQWGNGVDGGRAFLAWTFTMLVSTRALLGVALGAGTRYSSVPRSGGPGRAGTRSESSCSPCRQCSSASAPSATSDRGRATCCRCSPCCSGRQSRRRG